MSCTHQTPWAEMPSIGLQVTPADEYGPRVVLELRNCPCGSTLARVVSQGEEAAAEVPGA